MTSLRRVFAFEAIRVVADIKQPFELTLPADDVVPLFRCRLLHEDVRATDR